MTQLRFISLIGLMICAVVLGFAIYLEHTYMLAVCPLCILQRMAYLALGIVFLLGTIFKFSGSLGYVYLFLANLFTLGGSAIAARQFWLQYIAPPQKITCAASLEHLMEVYPFLDALKIALTGSGECSIIDFTILGMSIAAWSLFTFGTMFILALYFTYRYASKQDAWDTRINFK